MEKLKSANRIFTLDNRKTSIISYSFSLFNIYFENKH